jgi:hypothetical protein
MKAIDGNAGRKGRWFLGLFGLPFAGVGLGMLFLAVVPTLHDFQRMQGWEAVSARVTGADLHVSHGDDSDSFQAQASYDYRYGGRDYTGTRVAINDSGSDNIGDFQQRMAAELQRAVASGRPVTVWVNPADPAEAVYNRELRWGLLGFYALFALVFGGVGIGLVLAAVFAREKPAPLSAATAVQQGTPWLARAEWASPVIHARQRGGVIFLWIFAVVWCAIAAPANVVIPEELADGNYAILFILLFDAVGAGLFVWAIRQTISARKFGDTPLTLQPYPGRVDAGAAGELAGYFDARIPYDASATFRVSAQCVRAVTSGSGKNRSTRHTPLWQSELQLRGEPTADGNTRVWFSFAPPAGLPVSEAPSDNYVSWQVRAGCELPGVDFVRDWPVPVFVTAAGAADGSARRRMQVDIEAAAQEVEAATGFAQTASGTVMDYRAGRHWLGALMLGLPFGLGFGGAGVAMWLSADEFLVRWFMAPVFSLIGGVCLASAIWMLGNRLRVEASGGSVEVQRWLYGVPLRWHSVPREDIAGVGMVRNSSSSTGNKVTQYYGLVLRRRDDTTLEIGDGLKGADQAQRAGEGFARYANLPWLGEIARESGFAARKAAYQARRASRGDDSAR